MKVFFSSLKKRLGVLVLSSLLVIFFGAIHTEKVYAYPDNYNDFICLFTPTSTNCDHSAPPELVKRGEKSGITYGQPTKDGVTTTGIKRVVLLIGLSLNGEKDIRDGSNSESRYFYKRIADPRNNSFIVRLKYTQPNGIVSYQLETVPYSIYNNVAYSGTTIEDKNIKGPAYTNGQLTSISFYNANTGGDLMIEKSVISKTISFPSEIPYNSTTNIEADFWYCGGSSEDGEVNGLYAPRGADDRTTRVEYFTTDGKYLYKNNPNETVKIDGDHGIEYPKQLCNGEAAYKIGQTTLVSLPKTQVTAQTEAEQQVNSGVVSTIYTGSIMPKCHILDGWGPGSGSFLGCITNVFYYIIFQPVAWFAWLMGQIFDFFIGYSLSDEAYRHDFVQTAWQLVRDISNIFFIVIMIWSGLSAVFNTSKLSYKKVIPTLIINALIINFSLFATRIFIDISNITARLFYDRIEVCQKDDMGTCADSNGPGGFKSVSASIVSSFNPQKIIQNANLLNKPERGDFDPDAATELGSDAGDFNAVQSTGAKDTSGLSRTSDEYAAYFGLVTLIMIMVAFGTAMMFWKTAFMFVGRVIGLYVAMIFSPFAFLSRGNIPLVGGIPGINYSSWLKDLTNYAILAPIFVFFLYIIHSFLQVDFINGLGLQQNTSNFFEAALYVVVPMLIIYGLISKGVGIAKGLAGSMGDMVQKLGTTVSGVGLGIASGGIGLLGSRVIGGAAKKLDESRFGMMVRNSAAKNGIEGKLGKILQRGLDSTRSGSFDIRQSTVGKTILSQMGVDANKKGLNALAGIGLGLGTDQRKGGFDADVKRRQDDQEKKQKLLEEKMSDDQIKAYNQKQQDKRADRIESLIEKAMIATHGKANVADWKKNNEAKYDAEKANTTQSPAVQAEIAKVSPAKEIRSAAEMNKDRRKQFADNLKKPGTVDKLLSKVPIVGAVYGTNVRMTADKKAAKKIEESSKIEKELAEIESTLKKGFQDLIALDLFQSSPSFIANLSDPERKEIVKFGTIQTGPNKGKSMYDILTPAEKATIDAEMKQKKEAMSRGTDDEKKKAKEEYEEIEDLVKARESNKYDLKSLRRELKDLKEDWVNDPTNQSKKADFKDKIKEIKIAEKHESKWRDLNSYIKTRRDKLKGEEKK